MGASGGRDESFIVPAGAGGGAGVQGVLQVKRADAVVASSRHEVGTKRISKAIHFCCTGCLIILGKIFRGVGIKVT